MDNFPSHINDENDLNVYDEYLRHTQDNGGMKYAVKNDPPMEVKRPNMSYIPSDNHHVPGQLKNSAFMPAFLSKHIGKLVRLESLIGDHLETRVGILMTVGAGFVVLRQYRSNNTIVCDLYSIKYVTVIHDNDPKKLIP